MDVAGALDPPLVNETVEYLWIGQYTIILVLTLSLCTTKHKKVVTVPTEIYHKGRDKKYNLTLFMFVKVNILLYNW